MPEGTSRPIEPWRLPTPSWSEVSIGAALPTLQRRWRLIAAIVVTMMTAVGLALCLIPPKYTSGLTFLFEAKRNVLATSDIPSLMDGGPQDTPSVIGEIEVLESRDLARKVVEKLALDSDPEFAYVPDQTTPLGKVVHTVKRFLIPGEDGIEDVIDNFLNNLDVSQVSGSPAVDVTFKSRDPQKAKAILESLAQAFLVARLEDRVQNARSVGNWLAEQVRDMRTQVERARRAVADYRSAHGLISGERTELINERISKLSVELADASAARQSAEAQLNQLKSMLGKADSTSAVNRVIDSPLIQQLRQRQVELEQQVAQLSETLGSRHPQMIQIQAERQKLAAELQAEIGRLVSQLDYQARVARAKEQGLAKQLDDAKQEFRAADDASVRLQTLEREADSSQTTLEQFMHLVQQISAQSDLQAVLPNTRMISSPSIPSGPSFPQPIPVIAVSLIASLGLGVLIALLADHIDRRAFVSAEEVESSTGLPVLTLVPLARGLARGLDRGEDGQKPTLRRALFDEAIAALFTRMILMHRRNGEALSHRNEIKSVALTSCEPRAGKSSIALALARQQARCNRRVLLLDADFALSRLAQRVHLDPGRPGLAELLLDQTTIEEAVQQDSSSPLDIILPGAQTINHAALATSTKIQILVASLRERYDLVVIDTQPLQATAHAYQFACAADLSLLVVRWARTPRRQVAYALNHLALLGCNTNAVVLSMVDLSKNRRFGYGDSGYYTGSTSRYHRAKADAA